MRTSPLFAPQRVRADRRQTTWKLRFRANGTIRAIVMQSMTLLASQAVGLTANSH